jgi:hypothetical protein
VGCRICLDGVSVRKKIPVFYGNELRFPGRIAHIPVTSLPKYTMTVCGNGLHYYTVGESL